MKKLVPLNTTSDGCAFTIVARYDGRACLDGMTRGGGTTQLQESSKYPMNTDRDGCCKTIFSRMGRLSWENYLGRIEHGGWESYMTCILEIWNNESEVFLKVYEDMDDPIEGEGPRGDYEE